MNPSHRQESALFSPACLANLSGARAMFGAALLVLSAALACAEPNQPFLNGLFSDNMILQRDVPCPIWGWTVPGSKVAVTLNDEVVTVTAAADGRWLATIGPRASGGPYTLTVSGPRIRVLFDHADGLQSLGSGPASFAIAGADRKFAWAQARIDGNTVLVSAPEVSEPVAVRYGWSDNALCNLYNKSNLPAVPFRTDTW